VRLQRRFNEDLNRLSDSRVHIAGFIERSQRGVIHWSWPTPIDIDVAAYDDLVNLRLINILMSHYALVEKVNHDVGNLKSGYDQMTDALLRGDISRDVFTNNAQYMAQQMKMVDAALAHLQDETKNLLSIVRVMATKDLPPMARLTLSLIRTRMPQTEEIARERERLDGEIAAIMKASAAEIEKLKESSSER